MSITFAHRRSSTSLGLIVYSQLEAAYRLLEQEVRQADPWLFGERPLQADITGAVAFRFTREMLPNTIGVEAHPALTALFNAGGSDRGVSSISV